MPKPDGHIGGEEAGNKGVFQRSPLIATLFIIYVDRRMKDYEHQVTPGIKENRKSIYPALKRMNLNGYTKIETYKTK